MNTAVTASQYWNTDRLSLPNYMEQQQGKTYYRLWPSHIDMLKTVSNEVVLIANNHYCFRLTIPKHRHATKLYRAATNVRPLQGVTEPPRQFLSWWAIRWSWEPTVIASASLYRNIDTLDTITSSSNKGTLRLITGCDQATLTCYIDEQWSRPGSSILSLLPHNTETQTHCTIIPLSLPPHKFKLGLKQ